METRMTRRHALLIASLAIPSSAAGATSLHNEALVKPTRRLMIEYIARCTKATGEIPHVGRMGLGTWVELMNDFDPGSAYLIPPDETSHGFTAVDIADIPFYADLECEEGVVFLIHTTNPKACGKFSGLEHVNI
jgi:hypothetical protein